MRLYLVRHGKAELGPVDADRRLSVRGRTDVEAVAGHLAAQDLGDVRVLHSGLARARETAEVLAAQLAPGQALEELAGIEPWGDVKAFAKAAEKWQADTMVCGHEPFMGLAASLLLAGDADADLVQVKTGAVMALERAPVGLGSQGSWQLRWMLTPRIVRGPKGEGEL